MENASVSLNSIPREGTSQIFVNHGTDSGGGFKEIFVSQARGQDTGSVTGGKPVQLSGKNTPDSQTNEPGIAENDNENQPIFVDPPKGKENDTKPEQVTTQGFQGEAYPASDLFKDPAIPEELYSLTDADLAEPTVEKAAVKKQPEVTVEATAGLSELASLGNGDYAEPVTANQEPIDVAALTTRPFVQPIPSTGEITTSEPAPAPVTATTPATGSLSLTAADTSTLSTADALQAAVKATAPNTTAVKDGSDALAVASKVKEDAEVTPATSSGFLNGDNKAADARQIQAYTEAMIGRTNDGTVPNNQTAPTPATIDIAAMNARMAQTGATGTNPLLQPQTSPHALNFQEKGWETSFGQNIMWMANKDIKTAQIRIKPAELGPIHIELSMHKDQMTLQINATHHLARDTLEAALPRLRAELSNNGFADASINVGDQAKGGQTGGQGDSSALDRQPFSNQSGDDAATETDEIIPATSAMNLMSGTASLLDTFA